MPRHPGMRRRLSGELREAVVKAGNQATDPAMRKLVGPEEI